MSSLDIIQNWFELAEAAGYDVHALAQTCGVSGSQLRRYFTNTFAKSPKHWLNELRLWRAARQLCMGQMVKSVAADLAFSNSAHFCRCFKRYHGCTPLQFVILYRCEQKEHDDPSHQNSWDIAFHALSSKVQLKFQKRRRVITS